MTSGKLRSALAGTEARVSHRLCYSPPWLLDDPHALALMGSERWEALAAESRSLVAEPILRRARATVTLRFRYGEDRLAAGEYEQIVLLGAGLDTLLWRRPDLIGSLRVFELDAAEVQAWKRQRIDQLCFPRVAGHRFVPIDFETQTLSQGLDEVGFDWGAPTLFQCVGVAMYLTSEAVEATLRTVARCASGSGIVLSYNPDPALLDDVGREFLAQVSRRVERMGAPLASFLADVEGLLRGCGLVVRDHPSGEEMEARYGVRPISVERLVEAGVP